MLVNDIHDTSYIKSSLNVSGDMIIDGAITNDALNNTLNRTIITSLTIFMVTLVLFIFGGEVIRGFTFALLIGIIFDKVFFSQIFINSMLFWSFLCAFLLPLISDMILPTYRKKF